MEEVFLSVIVPAYNEEKRLGVSLPRILAYLDTRYPSYEVVVVDDGSTDQTSDIARRVAEGNQRVHVIRSDRNFGKGHAVKTGVLAAMGQLILFTDADLSTPMEELSGFLPWFSAGYDIVIGSRRMAGAQVQVHQGPIREFLGQGFTWLTNLLATGNLSDVTCGFKVFSRPVAQRLFAMQQLHDWSFDAEILFLARKRGYHIKEVPVRWRNDPRTKVSLLRDTWRSFLGLLRIRLNDWNGKYTLGRE